VNTTIRALGPARFPSPHIHAHGAKLRHDAERVLYEDKLALGEERKSAEDEQVSFEVAGPREALFFDPLRTTAGIVTCGGLCPGLNDVIRGIVRTLALRYGTTKIYGFRFGYEGLVPRYGHVPIILRPESVDPIHVFGGSILGTSRGPQDTGEMVDLLEEMNVDILFVIGGDGTLRGAADLCTEIERRGIPKSIIGIPKTIDNDIMFVDKSFGFETAFAEAVKVLTCAHTESLGSINGVGLVKLMGRDSGFIATSAALAANVANFVLIPEVPFRLTGDGGLLEMLRYRIARRKHAVIVVAEGAGQDLLPATSTTDASGNRHLGDIGLFLKDEIGAFFNERRVEVNVKYIDPSYIIRSVPASPQDNFFCSRLAQNAVHAAMAGKTGMVVGQWHGSFVHLPLELVTQRRQRVDPDGELWQSVLENTGQPAQMF
jgi:6-phosphofructokinase 1